MLDTKTIKQITHQVETRFPEISGCQPKIRPQAAPKTNSQTDTASKPRYLVTYHNQTSLSSGECIVRWVRVVVEAQGKIVKITTSR